MNEEQRVQREEKAEERHTVNFSGAKTERIKTTQERGDGEGSQKDVFLWLTAGVMTSEFCRCEVLKNVQGTR